EIEKNVNSLKRQVRKAQRYQEFRAALKEKEVRLATHEFSRIKHELEPLLEELHQTQDVRIKLTSEFGEKESQIEEARRKLLEMERSLSDEQRKLNELSQAIQKKEEKILVDRERKRALEEARARLILSQEEVEQKLARNQDEINRTKELLQGLFEQIQVAENEFQEKNAALKAIEFRVHEKNSKLKTIESQRLQAVEGLSESKKEEERLRTQLENIAARLGTIDKELHENALLQQIREEKLTSLQEARASKEVRLREVSEQLKAAAAEVESLEQAKEKARERVFRRRSELQTLKERIELLKRFIESYEDHPESVQHLLLHGHLNGGCKGTLAENLSVESRYRRAVETAIGEAAVSLVVEGTDQALQCIEILRTDEKGTATFFPLDRFAEGVKVEPVLKNGDLKGASGVIDWAYNLVKCSPSYRNLIRSLLNEYLVVKDLQTAKVQAERLRDKRINFITLDGEVITTWGPIKGGGSGASDTGVIGRKALVEELEAQTKNEFAQLEIDEKEQHDVDERLQKMVARKHELEKMVKAAELEVRDVEVELAQVNFESRKDQERRERLTNEKDELGRTRQELEQRLAGISPSLTDLAGDKSRFDSEFERISAALVDLEREVAEAREVAQESRLKLADLKGEERHLQENLGRLTEQSKELQSALQKLQAEMETNQTETEQLETQISENTTSIQGDWDRHKELETQVHELERTYLENKEVLDAKEKVVRDLRNKRETVSEALHGMELRVAELKLNAEKIKERIKEEYGYEIRVEAIDEALDVDALSDEIRRLKERLEAMGPVNLLALKEFEKEKSRLDFLLAQREDLLQAEANLNNTIKVINKTAREQFLEVFEKVKKNFADVFKGFFEKGVANLRLAENDDPLEAEVVIEADPKGRRISALTLLSGGEKTLTAISLLFAIYLVKPSPFCILDEVDAPLDDANITCFVKAIRDFSKDTQFIVITHNKLTMQASDSLYGITMEDEGVSKVVSVDFKNMVLEK
ncbi:MAG: chromosome segregation protein SMC, partial [Calditrichaeota bacterium]